MSLLRMKSNKSQSHCTESHRNSNASMKAFTLTTALVAFAAHASAHYIFEYFDNGAAYQNIRKNTNMNSPVTNLSSTDLRCNVGGLTGAGTTTATVQAGSMHIFGLDIAVYHQGPVSFYMSKAPAGVSLSSYDGSGDWFKIADIGPTFTSSCSATWDLAQSYSVTLPKSLPNGDYLLRVQQLAIHNPWPAGIPQFYIVREAIVQDAFLRKHPHADTAF